MQWEKTSPPRNQRRGRSPHRSVPRNANGAFSVRWSSEVKDLKEKTIRGGAARLVGQAVRSLVRIGMIVILARLLDPSDFGLVAMVTVVTGFFEIFATGGLSAAAVQRPNISDAQLSTLFWCNIAIGALLGATLPRGRSRAQHVLQRAENSSRHRCDCARLHNQCHRRSASRSSAKAPALCHFGGH